MNHNFTNGVCSRCDVTEAYFNETLGMAACVPRQGPAVPPLAMVAADMGYPEAMAEASSVIRRVVGDKRTGESIEIKNSAGDLIGTLKAPSADPCKCGFFGLGKQGRCMVCGGVRHEAKVSIERGEIVRLSDSLFSHVPLDVPAYLASLPEQERVSLLRTIMGAFSREVGEVLLSDVIEKLDRRPPV